MRETAVASDTDSGILSGRRAGAGIAVGVLTGPHSGDRLRRAGATHLIPSVAHLPDLLVTAEDQAPASAADHAADGNSPDVAGATASPPAANGEGQGRSRRG